MRRKYSILRFTTMARIIDVLRCILCCPEYEDENVHADYDVYMPIEPSPNIKSVTQKENFYWNPAASPSSSSALRCYNGSASVGFSNKSLPAIKQKESTKGKPQEVSQASAASLPPPVFSLSQRDLGINNKSIISQKCLDTNSTVNVIDHTHRNPIPPVLNSNLQGSSSLGKLPEVTLKKVTNLPPPPPPPLSLKKEKSVGGEINKKILDSINHECVKTSLATSQRVSQTPNCPAPSSSLPSVNRIPSVSQSNSTDKGINKSPKSNKQEPTTRWLAKPQEISQTPNCPPPSLLLPPVNQKNSIYKATNRTLTSFKEEPIKRWLPKLKETSQSPKITIPLSQPSFKPPPLYPSGQPSSPSPLDDSDAPMKEKYVFLQKDTTPLYAIPEDIKQLIKKNIVPQVLRKPLIPSTYRDYFAALLYAEDFYIEKWNGFCLPDVTLNLYKAAIYARSRNKRNLFESEGSNKVFVAFKIDSVPEKRPFLLSRDFVLVKPSGKKVEPFQGTLYRVKGGNLVLAEFGDDFHSQHSSNCKYDVSFSFNRVCLKRFHQAVASVRDPLLQNFLFPSQTSRDQNHKQQLVSAVNTIARLKDPPPYLIEGPLSVIYKKKLIGTRSIMLAEKLSKTGFVVKEAVVKIYRTSPDCRILINAPTNTACDLLMRSLREEIPESVIFRANAAFRELEVVPSDILPLCPLENDCFTCPSIEDLQNCKVILSTYVSSFRLYNEGISAGYFSHIFLVDASSVTEPETMVVLVNLADEKTVVVVNGTIGNHSSWVRSDIARNNGLKVSYFQRLLESEPWCSLDPMFVTQIEGEDARNRC